MDRRSRPGQAQKRRRFITLGVVGAVALLVIVLLMTEQVALLYVLATLSVAVLLIVVAMSDLKGTEKFREPAPFDDAAAISDGQTRRAQTATANTMRAAGAKRR